jgi:hypothetical protein
MGLALISPTESAQLLAIVAETLWLYPYVAPCILSHGADDSPALRGFHPVLFRVKECAATLTENEA